MAAHRFFLIAPLPRSTGEILLPLAEEDVRHAVKVLRVRPGEKLEVVDPAGEPAWLVEIVSASREGIEARPVERLAAVHEPDVTLVQSVAKGEKMDAIVRQAVELGVSAVLPVLTARSIVRLDAKKRVERGERWRRVAKAAAEQSHRNKVPDVADPADLHELRECLSGFDRIIVLWEESAPGSLHAVLAQRPLSPDDRVAVVVGPEGGLDAEEIRALESQGASVVGLGHTILRTETAAVVGIALVSFLLGGMGGSRE